MIMTDRKRSPNWQMPEKMLLVDLITDHFKIVENKRTDAVTMKEKNAEWIKISNEFNSQTSFSHRTAENLKAQWESLKKFTKKESAAARQYMIQTGGGPAKPKSDDPLFTRILGLISTVAVGLENPYDCDNFILKENETLATVKIPDVSGIFVPNTTVTKSTPLDLDIDAANFTCDNDKSQGDCAADWGDYTPKMLKSQKSAPLRAQSVQPVVQPAKSTPLALDMDIDDCALISVEDAGNTPLTQKKNWSSRRRPTLPVSSTLEELHKIKIKAVQMQMNFAAEEREEGKKIFEVEIKIKNEILKREKIKTRNLFAQMKHRRIIRKPT
ncbi:uncharacterized protein LOC125054019 [Pieris napi]|uniref:uncharacterized protein LOC125054019 n=1 Tax=Pieris napi TaxID=78633 RepID=UPI001FBAD466|nr:uncharacterized protein LOC125054019 [Pieris napi]